MDSGNAACLAYGAAISFLVSLLKSVPLVKRYPKLAVAVLAAGVAALRVSVAASGGMDWGALAECALIQFAGGVTTHEAIAHPINKRIDFRAMAAHADGSD